MARYTKKICIKCKLEKELSEFNKRKISKDGYRNDCKVCARKNASEYYNKNISEYKLKNKKWRISNPDKLKRNQKIFFENNPNYQRVWYQENKENINVRNKRRREIDTNYRLSENIRHLISNSLKYNNFKKNSKTNDILGCNTEEFRTYLESKFENWMNWENYGNPKDGILKPNKTWDIDHTIPISSVKTEEEIIRLNHFTNLQPLCSHVNRKVKRAKLI